MKEQSREFLELTADPLIYVLAIIIALLVMFFIWATHVQASATDFVYFPAIDQAECKEPSLFKGTIDIEKTFDSNDRYRVSLNG